MADGGVAEVARGEQEEGDPEQEEDAPDGLVGAEGDDPEQEGEEAPGGEGGADGRTGRGRRLEPAGAKAPVEEGVPPPEGAVGGEGDQAEGVAGLEFEEAGDELGEATVGEGERDDDGGGVCRQEAGVLEA